MLVGKNRVLVLALLVVLFLGVSVGNCFAQDKTAFPKYGFWGFGDFQNIQVMPKGGYFLTLKDITIKEWSGYSRVWKKAPYFKLNNCNTLVVEVVGTDTFESSGCNMMKWFVQYDGVTGDETILCTDTNKRCGDPEFVAPEDGTFEYTLPDGALQNDELTKIGITLAKGAKYGDVKIKAYFIRK